MAQRRISKAKTCQFGTVTLNEVLNPNLQFQSLYSQNLFEEHKVIVELLVFKTSKPKRRICVRPEKFQFLEKGQNRNFGYKIVISVKNPEFILYISDDETDFTIGIVS